MNTLQIFTSKVSYTSIILILVFCICACSEDGEKSIEELVIGSWAGDIIQENNGTLAITLNITTLNPNNASGTWITKSKDLSDCNTEIFPCTEFECDGILVFKESTGTVIKLTTELSNGRCWDEGEAQISNVTENAFNYSNVAPDGSRISGTFSRL